MQAVQQCPHCKKEVTPNPRYKQYLCNSCMTLLTDLEGKKVVYYNTGAMGTGCQGYYKGSDLKELYHSTICYIGTQMYNAQEARFGGIVILKKDN